MFQRVVIFVCIISLSAFYSSCSKYQRLLKNPDNELKLVKAHEYFNNKDYYRALTLYEQLLPVFRATEKVELIHYNYAYAYYNQRDYILASYYFKTFVKTFPRSEKAEECLFMSAYCKYLDSPLYSLDQTNTYEAINELQLFINAYPGSSRVAESNTLIDELRGKLEKKDYEIAKLYLRMDRYTAAITTFRNLLQDFPDSRYKEEAMFNIMKARYLYAGKSVASMKKERYHEASESYSDFVAMFPESEYSRDAKILYETGIKDVDKK